MIKLYTSAKHPQHWIAYVPGSGWLMFPARENGWREAPAGEGLSTPCTCVRLSCGWRRTPACSKPCNRAKTGKPHKSASSQSCSAVQDRPTVLLMKAQPLLRRHGCDRAPGRRFRYTSPSCSRRAGTRRESSAPRLRSGVFRERGNGPPAVPLRRQLRRVPRQRVAHLDQRGPPPPRAASAHRPDSRPHVAARVKVQRDLPALRRWTRSRLVNTPVRWSPGSRSIFSTRMPVSSLCSTSPCAACRISSSRAGLISSAASSTISHCVDTGSGMPSRCSNPSSAQTARRCRTSTARSSLRLSRRTSPAPPPPVPARKHLAAAVAAQPLQLIHGGRPAAPDPRSAPAAWAPSGVHLPARTPDSGRRASALDASPPPSARLYTTTRRCAHAPPS